jgi:fimbrial chaperone protein
MGLYRYFSSVILPCVLLYVFSAGSHAVSLSVWPIDPYLRAPSSASAVWVRNTSNEPVVLQARVLRWNQALSKETLVPQDSVVISPPMIELAGQSQQLFRVVHRSGAPNYSEEQSYRILIDEIPRNKAKNSAPLQFQMRYSLPFFIFPKGQNKEDKRNEKNISYRIVNVDKPEIVVTNNGSAHVRLSQVYLLTETSRMKIADGLLGYVLPNSTMSWPLPLDNMNPQERQNLLQANREMIFVQNHHEYRVVRAD